MKHEIIYYVTFLSIDRMARVGKLPLMLRAASRSGCAVPSVQAKVNGILRKPLHKNGRRLY